MYKYPPIYSRKEMEELIANGDFPEGVAVISFCDIGTPPCDRVDYSGVCDRVMYVEADDLECNGFEEYKHMCFPKAGDIAEFILDTYAVTLQIICQCEDGVNLSAACAAAYYEFFNGNCSEIFSDFRYSPNKQIYHKILKELREQCVRAELHAHTNMTMMKGMDNADDLITWAGLYDLSGLAITDTSVVRAFPNASLAAEEQYAFKMIYGMEGVLSDGLYENSTLVILAKNQIGLKNLYKLVTLSHLKNPSNPGFTRAELTEHREGLIIGSGGESGEFYRAIADGKTDDEIWKMAQFYDYLEICPSMSKNICHWIMMLGVLDHIPVCATGNTYYENPDYEIGYHISLNDKPRYRDSFKASNLYCRDTDQMFGEFDYFGKWGTYETVILNPNRIADSIEDIRIFPCEVPPIKITDEPVENSICIGKAVYFTEAEAKERVRKYAKTYGLDWDEYRIEILAKQLAEVVKDFVPSGKYLTFPEEYDIESLTPLQYAPDGKTLMTHFDLSFFIHAVKTAEELSRWSDC